MGILNNMMKDARDARRTEKHHEQLERLLKRDRENMYEQRLEADEQRRKQDEKWEEKRRKQEAVHEEERKYKEYLDFLSETPNIADDKELGGYLSKLIPLVEKKNHWDSISRDKIKSLSKAADERFKDILDILISMHPESKFIDFFSKKYDDWHREEEAKKQALEQKIQEKKQMRDIANQQNGDSTLSDSITGFLRDKIDKVAANAEAALEKKKSSLFGFLKK